MFMTVFLLVIQVVIRTSYYKLTYFECAIKHQPLVRGLPYAGVT